MKIKISRGTWLRIFAAVILAAGFCWGLFGYPQPLFHWSVSAANLTLYSDRAFDNDAGRRVLEMARAKLAASPLYSADEPHSAFICNARWRQRLFFTRHYGVGGVNYYPFTSNVFLRDAIIEDDKLISPSGTPVAGDRTLDYFIAHEITHTLTVKATGSYRYYYLPQWVREGYADYVGKGSAFNYTDALRAFMANTPEMDYQKSGLYWRYNLLVAHMLEKEHWTVQRLLEEHIDQQTVEDALRREASY